MPDPKYDGYGWIKVKKHKHDPTKSWEENYKDLDKHHVEETTFLINTVREIAGPSSSGKTSALHAENEGSTPSGSTKKAMPERICEICNKGFFYGENQRFNWFYCDDCCKIQRERNVPEKKVEIFLFLTNRLSQWYRSDFEIDGIKYNCCEQWMMAEKARLFGDKETLEKIMKVDPNNPNLAVDFPGREFEVWPDYPRLQKELGREVKGFNKEQWEKVAQDVVYRGNYAKFTIPGENGHLWDFLQATGEKILAEANPRDPIWGIGLSREDPRAQDPTMWKGKNWLGEALMKVRAKVNEEKKVAAEAKQ